MKTLESKKIVSLVSGIDSERRAVVMIVTFSNRDRAGNDASVTEAQLDLILAKVRAELETYDVHVGACATAAAFPATTLESGETLRLNVETSLEKLAFETSPEETSPEETSPEETSPVETSPEETSPEETSSEETSPEETSSEETSPEETSPEETSPEETPSEETSSEETSSEETSPEETPSEETSFLGFVDDDPDPEALE